MIDAAGETQGIRENLPDVQARKDKDGSVNPDDVAANYINLDDQPRNAWTFELDIRPWEENW